METIYIYGLVDPETFQIRYIGQTENIEGRLRVHISVTETNIRHKRKLTYKESWIVSLLTKNLQPLIIELDRCNKNDWEQVESWWIDLCRSIKLPLTNLSNGGKAIFRGRHHTKEAIELIRNNKKGKIQSEETRQKQSKIRKGRKLSEEHRKNIGLSKAGPNNPHWGKHWSEETKRKMSESNKGKKVNDETKIKLSLSHTGLKFPGSVKEKMALSGAMHWAWKKNDFNKIKQLQIIYFSKFGKYQQKYETWK